MRLPALLLIALLARLAAAQAPDTTHGARGATVSGVVRDSIARTPLARAMVQLVGTDSTARIGRTTVSDSLGRFTLIDVPAGRYALGFFHPMLDSLGLEPTLREVLVDGHQPVRADLAIPSPMRIRAAICGTPAPDESGAVLVGVVRDASDRAPAAGVTVSGDWLEFTFGHDGLTRHIQRRVTKTGENGWFSMCNVPSAGTVALIAIRGADSTDVIEVQVPTEGFVRRELYLGHARTVVIGDTATRADTLAPPLRRLHVGDGRVSGTVVTAVEGRPLDGAQVSIVDGPRTRANERGEWTIVDAPAGTRTLEVRALGYYPERRAVDVVAGVAPVRVVLSTLKAVLDTVKVMASRLTRGDRTGFQERRRSAAGRYLTSEDIVRRHPLNTSDIFKMVPGVRLVLDPNGFDTRILVRGNMSEWCLASFYLDGHLMNALSTDEIDTWVHPNEVKAIEIYSGAGAPAEFQRGMRDDGCGSIVIWTK
jgi:Carboxypeptidase regulatory-like domain/TonB-dependent Receptor Plug Domain